MELHTILKIKGNKDKAKRKGRGIGSRKGGHTVGFGQKGQTSRKGNSIPSGFEGGQVPIFKKLPQIGGFKSPKRVQTVSFSLSTLNLFEEGSVVTPKSFVENGILSTLRKTKIKIVGTGNLEKKLSLKDINLTKSAQEKLESLGGTIVTESEETK